MGQKLAELAEVLDVREKKLVEVSHENMDLIETNNDFRKQVSHTSHKHVTLECDKCHTSVTHTPIRMFCVKRRRRRLISKSSFSRQCVGRIRDTCSQLT